MRGLEVSVVKIILENKDEELSISHIAKLLKKDYKNTHNMTSRLSRLKLIKLQPFGRSHRVALLSEMHPLIFEAEYLRRNELLRNKNIAVMNDSFKALHSKLYILLLFGSYAKKTQTKQSDIDLLFIIPDASEEKIEKEIQTIADTLPLKIHVNIFKESDFKAMKDSRTATVGSEAIKNNIILHGIESYYELLQ